MRLIIIGAGAVGGTLGARLFQSGHDVVLVARGRHLDAIRSDGLTLHTADGTVTLPVPAVSGPGELDLTEDDVLVCAVKSQDTHDVLDTWAHASVGPAGRPAAATLPFVVAQNGVANEVSALRLFARVYPVCVWLPASYLEPGVVHAEGAPFSGFLTVGRLGGPLDDVSAALVGALGASRFVAVEDADVMRWKHGKLLSNLRNGLDAACDRGPRTRELAERLGEEGRAVLTAAGIAFSTPQEEAARRGDAVQVRPAPGTDRGGSSTWQSLARGTGGIEVDYLNGEIGLLGRLHGVATPVNDAVQQAAHRLRRDGRPPRSIDVAELEALVADAEAARA
jgi:2-dehydropantoate 2-reductase